MVLDIDDDPCDLLIIDGGEDLHEALSQIREAAELALMGLRQT